MCSGCEAPGNRTRGRGKQGITRERCSPAIVGRLWKTTNACPRAHRARVWRRPNLTTNASASKFASVRTLLAEDDAQLRESIARGLLEADYTVDHAATGTQALDLVSANEYDVIVLDVLLPGHDGKYVCRAIRASGSRVPILMLTALDAVEDRIAGLDAGADDYLTKPFDFGELLARLRALTRRSAEPAAAARLVVGDLAIDTVGHTVRRNRRDISLTPKEFALLAYLARNAGRVVTRAELITHVWDDANTYSNIIDAYAARLRRKIDHGEKVPLLTTLRGSGFILEAPAAHRAGSGVRRSPV